MERTKTVVDASVVIKLFISEPGSNKAEKLLQSHIEGARFLYAPDLLLYEVGNALHFRNLPPEAIKRAFQDLAGFQLHTERASTTLLFGAARLAKTYGLTVYDAAYAALAETLGAELVTADEKLAKLPCGRHLKTI